MITHVGMTDNEGLAYGLDGVTPVAFEFYNRDRPKIRYCWRLPQYVIDSAAFQDYAKAYPKLVCSFNELCAKVRQFHEAEVRTFGSARYWYAEVYPLPVTRRVFQTPVFQRAADATEAATKWARQQGYLLRGEMT